MLLLVVYLCHVLTDDVVGLTSKAVLCVQNIVKHGCQLNDHLDDLDLVVRHLPYPCLD